MLYISNFRNSGDDPLGLYYPSNDKKWPDEIRKYDGPEMSPSIKEGRKCKYNDCKAIFNIKKKKNPAFKNFVYLGPK